MSFTIRLFLNLKEMPMKKIFVSFIVMAVVVTGCSSKKESVKLQQGTPAYQLAKDLTATLSMLDPEKNAVLVTAKELTVTVADVIQTFQDRMGNQAAQVKTQIEEQIKKQKEQAVFESHLAKLKEKAKFSTVGFKA
jgi:hypothetical protein